MATLRTLADRICETCGGMFRPADRHKRFCSKSCSSQWIWTRRQRPSFEVGSRRTCRKCQSVTAVTESMSRLRQFTCAACASKRARILRKVNPSMRAATIKRWRERHPEKRRAQTAVMNAIAVGRLMKPGRCEQCEVVTVEAHHDDYSKPLSVQWLCRTCHVRADRKRRQREQSERLEQCG